MMRLHFRGEVEPVILMKTACRGFIPTLFCILASQACLGPSPETQSDSQAVISYEPRFLNVPDDQVIEVGETWSYTPIFDDTLGTVTATYFFMPAGMTVDGTTMTWTPTAEQIGVHWVNYAFVYTDTDGVSQSAAQFFDLEVIEASGPPPPPEPTLGDCGQPIDPDAALGVFGPITSVPDSLVMVGGPTFAYAPQVDANATTGNAVVTGFVGPDGMLLSRGELRWMPTTDQRGVHRVLLCVDVETSNGVWEPASQLFEVAVGDVVTTTQTISAQDGGTITIAGTNTSLDGASITFPPGKLSRDTAISVDVYDIPGQQVFAEDPYRQLGHAMVIRPGFDDFQVEVTFPIAQYLAQGTDAGDIVGLAMSNSSFSSLSVPTSGDDVVLVNSEPSAVPDEMRFYFPPIGPIALGHPYKVTASVPGFLTHWIMSKEEASDPTMVNELSQVLGEVTATLSDMDEALSWQGCRPTERCAFNECSPRTVEVWFTPFKPGLLGKQRFNQVFFDKDKVKAWFAAGGRLDPEIRALFVHELFHVIQADYAGHAISEWWKEAMAAYVESELNPDSDWATAYAPRGTNNTILPWDESLAINGLRSPGNNHQYRLLLFLKQIKTFGGFNACTFLKDFQIYPDRNWYERFSDIAGPLDEYWMEFATNYAIVRDPNRLEGIDEINLQYYPGDFLPTVSVGRGKEIDFGEFSGADSRKIVLDYDAKYEFDIQVTPTEFGSNPDAPIPARGRLLDAQKNRLWAVDLEVTDPNINEAVVSTWLSAQTVTMTVANMSIKQGLARRGQVTVSINALVDLHGSVVDQNGNIPEGGAWVSVYQNGQRVAGGYAGSDGLFEITNMHSNYDNLTIEVHCNYRSQTYTYSASLGALEPGTRDLGQLVIPGQCTEGIGPILYYSWGVGAIVEPFVLYAMNPDGTNVRQVLPDGWEVTDAEWSPDGSQIAFSSSVPTSSSWVINRLYLANADGTVLKQISGYIDERTDDGNAQFTPDGQTVVFERFYEPTADRPQHRHIWAVDLNSLRQTQLTPGIGRYNLWDINPDGDLVFTGATGSELCADQICLMRPDGSDVRVLFSSNDIGWIHYSQDGSKMAYRNYNTGIVTVVDVASGSAQTYATVNSHKEVYLSPDASQMIINMDGLVAPYIQGTVVDVGLVDLVGGGVANLTQTSELYEWVLDWRSW